ncbi:17734_t:CDS:2 [Racocetra fulgida]|uniref:17734_t:CDS:1 n=1 Tax=Racocetra fulgida TaxID=60492 RepID=A0A9N8ZG04_9GLOM|nr:17734_t:CDS:2 [Racocetra fulgida]
MTTAESYSILSTVNNVTLQFTRCDCAPQTCFILFRNVIQDCVTSLNIRIERHDLSRHASNLWNQLKQHDAHLIDEFRRVARLAAQQFYSSQIRIINVNIPVAIRPQTNAPIPIDDENLQKLLRDLFPDTLPPQDFHQ